jgi:uncharacterized glyoxalase superfamily protein PhnB
MPERRRTMSESTKRPTLGTAISCKDPRAELEWLERAFGFERTLVITNDSGNIAHSEMSFGNGYIMVAGEWANMKPPSSLDGANTQAMHVQLDDGIDGHCERARAAGGKIVQEPEDQFYGDRTYRCLDPEGHMWTFGQTVKVVSQDEWDAASGLKTELMR